ncbi:MAG: polymer-forming cytoskeletal protein [Planctomycetes bacterium]|nr:polymer-forming cytoskeletal protein [Planctomycetota bacterium]
MKKTSLIIISCLALFLLVPLYVYAYTVKSGTSVYVAKDETVNGNLYAVGNAVTVEGRVEGDVICAGQTINVNGEVLGDVICAGQTINVNGKIGGSVRAAGNSLTVNGEIARNVMVFGASILLGTDAKVGWDMFFAGAAAEIRGDIAGDLHGGGANTVIAGKIGGNVRLRLDERVRPDKKGIYFEQSSPLEIAEGAEIGGDVSYLAGNLAKIADNAKIAGEITYREPQKRAEPEFAMFSVWLKLISFFAALVVGLVLTSLWRKGVKDLTDGMLDKIGASIGWGIVIMFIAPILAVILMVTLIGIPLALIGLGLWLIALYLAKILAGITIGRAIMERLWPRHKESLVWGMIAGIALLWLIGWIPLLGWLVTLAATWWGLGGIWLRLKKS